MKTTLLILFFLFSLFAKAQTIYSPTFSTAGGKIENGAAQIMFTIGEPLMGVVKNGAAVLQGFWASIGAENTLGGTDFELDSGELVVYPNPVKDDLNIRLNRNQGYSVSIYSLSGQKLLTKTIEASVKSEQINLSTLGQGIYLLQLEIPGQNASKTIKIIKN